MGKNYYEVLGVPKTADENEIKKAYKKAALKYHPDRPGGDKVKFQEVSEAFEVLSDNKKKKIYDQFGEAGLGMSGPGDDSGNADGGPFPGMGAHSFSFRTTQGGGGSSFHGSDAFNIFESMFGTGDINQAMGDAGGEPDEEVQKLEMSLGIEHHHAGEMVPGRLAFTVPTLDRLDVWDSYDFTGIRVFSGA